MNEHYVYIIYSQLIDAFYIGETENLNQRLLYHNNGTFQNAFTKKANDWVIKISFSVNNRKNARLIEKYIKNMKSRKFIMSLISNTEFKNKFIDIVLIKFNITIQ